MKILKEKSGEYLCYFDMRKIFNPTDKICNLKLLNINFTLIRFLFVHRN